MNKLISLESTSLITFIFDSFPRVVSDWRMDCIGTLSVFQSVSMGFTWLTLGWTTTGITAEFHPASSLTTTGNTKIGRFYSPRRIWLMYPEYELNDQDVLVVLKQTHHSPFLVSRRWSGCSLIWWFFLLMGWQLPLITAHELFEHWSGWTEMAERFLHLHGHSTTWCNATLDSLSARNFDFPCWQIYSECSRPKSCRIVGWVV